VRALIADSADQPAITVRLASGELSAQSREAGAHVGPNLTLTRCLDR
jgi:hypothetical protein